MEIFSSFELVFLGNLLLALLYGGLIGIGREIKKKPAGMRTHSLVVAAAMTFSYLSPTLGGDDPSRIASQVEIGVGYIGAGIIFQSSRGRIKNLTTAASVWHSAAVGMALGFGFYLIALSAVGYAIVVTAMPKFSSLINQDS